MLGRVNYITKNLYQESYPYDNIEGHDFENQMHLLISNAVQRYYVQGLRLKRTPNTRDDGKDMIITSPVDFFLFGRKFKPKNGKDEITVYIECKSTKDIRVNRDKFSHNILVANDSNIDYFVLITNKCITPEAYYLAMSNAKENEYEFVLFDKIILNIFTNNYIPPSKETISYQIMTGIENGENRLDIFLLFQNHSSKKQLFKYNLKSNRNWKLSEEPINKFIEPYCCVAVRVTAFKEYNDGIDDLLLNIEYDNNTKTVSINEFKVDYVFETPLVGQQHKDLINLLSENILNNFKKIFIHIHGEAGIGKTRIKDEIIKRVQDCGIDIFQFRCIENQNNDKKDFISFMQKKGIINSLGKQYSRYIVVLEDFHYASRCLIDYIIECSNPAKIFPTPISFIILGRSDDTIYNKEYIRFTEFSKKSQYIFEKEIQKLTSTDCIALIKTIIKEVPQKVLDDICYAAENNPFYIIQFIEYLLESKLINIANRNTVGIINATTFRQKIYIPHSIEELLEKRINLLKERIGMLAYDFLFVLAFKKNICACEIFDELFVLDENAKEYLLQHHFVKNDSSEQNVIFEHENIYRYCTKLISTSQNSNELFKKIYKTDIVFKSLNIFEKGKVYYKNELYDDAINCYQEIIKQIRLFDNVAAINLPYHYLDYIDDIYDISLKRGDYEICEKSILSVLYISLHNITNGHANQNINSIEKKLQENHKNNHKLQISYKQMKMHYYMQCGNNLKALQLGTELLAIERYSNSDLFSEDVRFNLFDRMSSLYNQLNHKELAMRYNELAFNIAKKEKNDTFYALSYMTASKICFFYDTEKSLEYMKNAQNFISCAQNTRLSCHNTLSIISAKLLSKTNADKDALLQAVTEQLNIANKIQYPIAQIRSYYLMAVLLYTQLPKTNEWDLIISYLDKAIELCIYNASIKLLPNIYNMKAIIANNLNKNTDLVFKYYNTMLLYLKHQNQLFLGNFDFTYSNVINLTNYALFLLNNNSENEYYNFMSQIDGYGVDVFCNFKCSDNKLCFYSCTNALDKFKQIEQELSKHKFINNFNALSYNLMDMNGEYYIPLLV